jgi:hypothetical protein
MAYLNDRVLDFGLNILDTEADRLDICSQEPTTFAQATSTYSLGNKTGLNIGSPAAKAGGGREVTVPVISDGSVTASGTATHYAIVDTVNSRLLATKSLQSSQAVTNGNTFSMPAFTIGIPGAV